MTESEFRMVVSYAMKKLREEGLRHQYSFSLPDGRNEGFLRLRKGDKPETQVCLDVGARLPGDDHLVMHFMHQAPSQEAMSAWLKKDGNVDRVIESLLKLGKRVDEGFE